MHVRNASCIEQLASEMKTMTWVEFELMRQARVKPETPLFFTIPITHMVMFMLHIICFYYLHSNNIVHKKQVNIRNAYIHAGFSFEAGSCVCGDGWIMDQKVVLSFYNIFSFYIFIWWYRHESFFYNFFLSTTSGGVQASRLPIKTS
jgi:hypothetical protein